MLEIQTIPTLKDNYSYLLLNRATACAAVIDPGEAAPILTAVQSQNLKLTDVLCTHHHADHVGGIKEIREEFNSTVWSSNEDLSRIPGATSAYPLEEFEFLGSALQSISCPGHTHGQHALYFKNEKALFTGDTLFIIGCGRLFEGTAEELFLSLQTLAKLPGDTQIFCGHEYTLKNIRFAKSHSPVSEPLLQFEREMKTLVDAGRPTVPSLLLTEIQLNPFLKCRSSTELAGLRKLKDEFV